MNLEGCTQIFHVEFFKVTFVVYKNGSWDTKVTYNMIDDEFRYLNSYGGEKSHFLNLLDEIIYSIDYPFMAL